MCKTDLIFVFYARPQPDVDSPAPARSALRAFGFAEFLSLIPNRLKSPREEGTAIAGFLFCGLATTSPAHHFSAANTL
jgi:hypothetical protein